LCAKILVMTILVSKARLSRQFCSKILEWILSFAPRRGWKMRQ